MHFELKPTVTADQTKTLDNLLTLRHDGTNKRVGVGGTTNPSVELDVSGDGKFSGDLTVDGSLNIGAITDVETYVNDISSNLSNLSQNKIENGNSNVTVESSNGPISFDTNGSERMKILTNGNVGIGTNPSTNLDVSGEGKFSGDLTIDGSLNIHDGLKVYYDSGISANQILSSEKFIFKITKW